MTNDFTRRIKEHFNNVKKMFLHRSDPLRSLHVKSKTNSKLYRYVSKKIPFTIVPIIRVHNSDGPFLERFLIKTFGTHVLNSERSSFAAKKPPQIVISRALKSVNSKRKRRKKTINTRQNNSELPAPLPKHIYRMKLIKPTMMMLKVSRMCFL